MAAVSERRVAAEFLVEPFAEGEPGPHVQAAVEAFTDAGLDVDLGAFASLAEGEVGAVADALAAMIRQSIGAGATRLRIQVGVERSELTVGGLQQVLGDMMRVVEREIGTAAVNWDRAEKQRAVRLLNERGAFLLRGSVEDVAAIMGVSRITIYNYLNALEAD